MSHWQKLLAASNPTSFDPGGILSGMAASTAAGVAVTPDSALKLSTVFACVRLLSETIGALPLSVFERLPGGKRAEATNHPLYDLLHDQPNSRQTAIEFRSQLMAHMCLRGNAYAQIVPGARGFADELRPIHPDAVTPEELADGSMRYRVSGERVPFTDAEILHLKGMSFDGKMGVSVITYMRESVGLGIAAERYGARFFGNGAQPGAVLQKADGKALSEKAAARVKASWEAAHQGDNQHRVAVLEEGLTYHQTGLSNRDSQFLELRENQAEDIAGRWFGVPPHMVGLTSKATSWGSGIEQMGIGFVVYTLLPWLVRWEQGIARDLIIAPKRFFVKHVVAGLLRGDTQARYAAYAIGRQWGWLSVNDIRRLEDMDPIEGGDIYLTPLNMGPAEVGAQAAAAMAAGKIGAPGAGDLARLFTPGDSGAWLPGATGAPAGRALPAAHYEALLAEAAGRVVRKEIAAITRMSERAGSHSDLDIEIKRFYLEHVAGVEQALRIPYAAAARWCGEQLKEVSERGPAAMADWEFRRAADLVNLAMEAQS